MYENWIDLDTARLAIFTGGDYVVPNGPLYKVFPFSRFFFFLKGSSYTWYFWRILRTFKGSLYKGESCETFLKEALYKVHCQCYIGQKGLYLITAPLNPQAPDAQDLLFFE